jgi:sulfite exporter TauE/SafE
MHHLPSVQPIDAAGDAAGLFLALFLTGLAGSFTHCAAMCGPFVIAQIGAGLERDATRGLPYGTLARLRGAALLPYHLAAASGMVGFLANAAVYRALAALLLTLAAAAMLLQALGRGLGIVERLLAGVAPTRPPALARAFLTDPSGWRGYVLGVLLGFLPCAMVYAALAAAAAAGDPLRGALAMAAFAAGTVPGLAGVGWAGALFGRRWRRPTAILAPDALLASSALLLATAWRLVG